MFRFLVVFFLISGKILTAQHEKPGFDPIFGCSCCADTLINASDKKWKYILSENKTTVTAWKSGKEKWSRSVFVFGDRNVRVTCMELFLREKKFILHININDKEYIDLNPKTGETLFIKNTVRDN